MTIDQIRITLDELESNYGMAMDFRAYPLAQHLREQIQRLQNELIQLVMEADPYTTEADVRYFEGF